MIKDDDIYKKKLKTLLSNEVKQEIYDFHNSPFILFGAGKLCTRTMNGLDKLGIKPRAIGDNSLQKIGTKVNGMSILSTEEIIKNYGNDVLIVLSIWGASSGEQFRVSNIINQLKIKGLKNVIDITKLYNQYPNEFLPHYCLDLPHKVLLDKSKIIESYELFNDRKSQKQFYNQIRWKLLYDNWNEFVEVEQPIYFQDDIYQLRDDDVIYDCGAYDGDTIKMILNKSKGKIKRIVSFEPDKNNYCKIMEYILEMEKDMKDKVEAHQYAVGDKKEVLLFQANEDGSSNIDSGGNCQIESIAIDDFIKNNQIDIPTIIKMDIEGFETKALIGAQNTIKEYSPILTICVYHKQNDLWEIPLLIKSINENYTFYLRHHVGDCWDTVLYAVPKNRLIKER